MDGLSSIDCCTSSELRPETKKLGEMCTSSAPKMVLPCVNVLPFLSDSSGHTCHFKTHLWSSTHSSSLFQRGLARHSRRLPLPTVLEGPGMLQNSHILHPGQDIGSGFSDQTTLNVAECHPWKKGGLVMPCNACRKYQAPVASPLSELRAIWVHPKSLSVRSFHHALQDYRSICFVRKPCSQHASNMAEDGWHMGSNHRDSTVATSNKACHKGIVSGQRNGRKLAWISVTDLHIIGHLHTWSHMIFRHLRTWDKHL